MTKVRRLGLDDVGERFPLRLRALATRPLAFCALHSEEEARGPGRIAASLAEVERFAVFGAFDDSATGDGPGEGALVGMVGVYRERYDAAYPGGGVRRAEAERVWRALE